MIAKHGLTLKNGIANYKLGDDIVAKSITNETISITEGTVVALEAVSEDFAEWIITDAKGNALDLDIKTVVTNVDENGGITWETVDGDLSCENIIFTMPTEDVIITLRTTKTLPQKTVTTSATATILFSRCFGRFSHLFSDSLMFSSIAIAAICTMMHPFSVNE